MLRQIKILCVSVVYATVCLVVTVPRQRLAAQEPASEQKRVDVNDISILWPVPKSTDDVAKLITADEKLDDGTTAIWPQSVFQKVLETAQTVSVKGSGNREGKIKFRDFKAAFESPATWRIAGIRVDPSAPSCTPSAIQVFGSTPQIRLILQPVTVEAGKVRVHDVSAHLVFDFVLRTEMPVAAGLPPKGVPDREHFKAILEELISLKASLKAAGVVTDGELDVHPALRAGNGDFVTKIRALLKKHLSADRLNAVAFMGVDEPEPWIFFAMAKRSGGFERVAHPSFAPEMAQMLTMRGGEKVMPQPTNSTLGKKIGVSTAQLFKDGIALESPAVTGPVPAGMPALKVRDIPDAIANPRVSHFFNTDCMSCHSESAQRAVHQLDSAVTPLKFERPEGISGVKAAIVASNPWNVRCFGWFPDFFGGNKAIESITMRTANETAEAAEFINRDYFGVTTPPPSVTAAETPATPAAPPNPVMVANALTLVMTIKSPEDRQELKQLLAKLQSLPADRNPITVALTKLGNVHFARFVFIGDDKLAVITAYDDDFETYINSFVDEIGPVFDQLLAHMKDAPPLPVEKNRQKFLEYVEKNDLKCEPPFFSAYPKLKVQDILTLQKQPPQ